MVEHAGVEQLVFDLLRAAAALVSTRSAYGYSACGYLYRYFMYECVGVIEVEVVFLDVFAVIALAVGQAEQPLLEDRVLAVPQREGKAQALLVVGDAGEAVLAPAIGARARLVVGEVVPGVAVVAVVLAHGSPLALAQIRSPFFPRRLPLAVLLESDMFSSSHQ